MNEKKISSETYNIVSLLLAEKRTSLAVLRTGIAIFTLPISVFTILIATSNYYDLSTVTFLIAPLLIICIILTILGAYFMIRSFRKIKETDYKIQEIKKQKIKFLDF
jgi:uncharacterized membrane protein YidH (DUF202 family)